MISAKLTVFLCTFGPVFMGLALFTVCNAIGVGQD